MEYEDIRRCLGDCRFTDHARREMEAEAFGVIRVDEVLQVLEGGEIIEEYPDDTPYPSALVLGRTGGDRALHVVCALVLAEERLVIITTYQPDPNRWDPGLRIRRRS